jgi:tetratricopeptide (TPR) repeat protein
MLRIGQILAGRYQVAAFLGHGAVGEVYEAEDLELGERIAVKILHPGIAGDEQALHRFKQEIQLARRVTHPNVCRTYDLVYHREPAPPDAPARPWVFLTMELLRGKTLEERLALEGRMTPGEALPLVRQIAAALGAAHAAGVVHRDLKSANIVLESSPAGVRAVVNDFGLAWSADDEASSPALEPVGSPAYMAPEQVRGEPATAATDIYALGVVLYEMVTGDLPFLGESAFYTAVKRLQELPPSPRDKVAELDPVWEEVILRCLKREPADRFSAVGEVVRALSGAAPQAELNGWHPRIPRAARIAAACLLVLLPGAFALLSPRVRSEGPEPKPAGPLRRELHGLATALQNTSALRFELEDLAASRRDRQEALLLSQQIGDEEGIAKALDGLANLDRQEGDLTGAQQKYEQVLAIYRRLGQPRQEASALHEIGRVWTLRREPQRALKIFDQALALCGGPSRCPQEASILNDIGRARWALGELAPSHAIYERSLKLSRAAHDNLEEAKALVGLGYALIDLGRPGAAQAPFEQALAIFQSRGNRGRATMVISGMGRALAVQGDYRGALRKYKEARAIRLELGERFIAAESLLTIAELALEHHDFTEAARSAREAAQDFRQLGAPQSEAKATAILSLCQQGRPATVRF